MSWLDTRFKEMFTMTSFYGIGAGLFLIMAIANSFNLYSAWKIINEYQKISMTASVVFNLLLVTLFFSLYRSLYKKELAEEDRKNQLTKEDVEKIVNEAK